MLLILTDVRADAIWDFWGQYTDSRVQEKYNIQCTGRLYQLNVVYQILVTKICGGGRISHILTNFIPNISALNSEHFPYKFF